MTFFDNVGSITPLGGLSVTGLTNLNGNVTTNNGAIAFNNAVLLDTQRDGQLRHSGHHFRRHCR